MSTKYILEYWDNDIRKYIKLGEYDNMERAEIMFNKSYNSVLTRRLTKVTTEIIFKRKGTEYAFTSRKN